MTNAFAIRDATLVQLERKGSIEPAWRSTQPRSVQIGAYSGHAVKILTRYAAHMVRFEVGDPIVVDQIGGGTLAGRVKLVNTDNTYTVQYDDGSRERVGEHLVKVKSSSSRTHAHTPTVYASAYALAHDVDHHQ